MTPSHTTLRPSKIPLILFIVAMVECSVGFTLHEFGVLVGGFDVFDNELNSSTLSRHASKNIINHDLLWQRAIQSRYSTAQRAIVFDNIDTRLCEFGVLGCVYDIIWDGFGFDWNASNIFESYFNEKFHFICVGNVFNTPSSGMCVFVFFLKFFCCTVAKSPVYVAVEVFACLTLRQGSTVAR